MTMMANRCEPCNRVRVGFRVIRTLDIGRECFRKANLRSARRLPCPGTRRCPREISSYVA